MPGEGRRNVHGTGTNFSPPLLVVNPGVGLVGLEGLEGLAPAPPVWLYEITAKSTLPDKGLIRASSIFPRLVPWELLTSEPVSLLARIDCPILPVGSTWLRLLVTLDDVPGAPGVPPGVGWASAVTTTDPAVNAIILSSCLINLPFVVAVVSAKNDTIRCRLETMLETSLTGVVLQWG